MNLSRIFTIFLLLWLCMAANLPLYGEIPLTGRNLLFQDNCNGEDAKFLRSALRRVDRWARDAKVKRPKQRVLFRTAAKQWEIINSPKYLIVQLPGTAGQWQNSFEMRRVLFSIIFRSRFDLPLPDKPEKHPLPVWMSAAVDEAMASRLSNEQFYSGNKDYLALQMILKKQNRLPAFTALCGFEERPGDPASREVFNQMSLLLMELAAENGLLRVMLDDHCANRPPDSWSIRFSNSREAQAHFADMALKMLWNHRTPPPAELRQDKLDSLKKIVLPELDAKQIPTGKMLTLTFAEANKLLHDTTRPDTVEIRRYYSREWNRFSFRQSQSVRNLCSQLSKTASQLGENELLPQQFEKLFAELEKQLARENNVMREIIIRSFHTQPLDQLYLRHFSILDSEADTASTAAVDRFLRETEKKYLENY